MSENYSRLFACSIVTSGLSYGSVRSLFDKSGFIIPVKKTKFFEIQQALLPWASKAVNSLMDSRIAALRGQNVRISVDGRWSSHFQALEGTVTCFDSDKSNILDVQHIGEQIISNNWYAN